MTCRAAHPEQEPITAIGGCRIDPERGVILVSDKPQLPIYQGIRVECPQATRRMRAIRWRFENMAPPSHLGP